MIEKVQYETIIRDLINKNINYYQSLYIKNERLNPINLPSKLNNDINLIFQFKRVLDIKDIISNAKFEISEEKKNQLIKYYDLILETLKETKGNKNIINKDEDKYKEIKNMFIHNLEEVIKNSLSRQLYNICFYRIEMNITKKMKDNLLIWLNNFCN